MIISTGLFVEFAFTIIATILHATAHCYQVNLNTYSLWRKIQRKFNYYSNKNNNKTLKMSLFHFEEFLQWTLGLSKIWLLLKVFVRSFQLLLKVSFLVSIWKDLLSWGWTTSDAFKEHKMSFTLFFLWPYMASKQNSKRNRLNLSFFTFFKFFQVFSVLLYRSWN